MLLFFFSIFYQCIESLVSRYELLCLCVVPASKINFKHLLILTYFISLSLAFFQKSSQDVLFSDGWLLMCDGQVSVSICLVCHKSEFYRNGWTNRDGFGMGASFRLSYTMLRRNMIPSKIKSTSLWKRGISGLEKFFLFCKSFPLQPFFFFFRTDYMDSPDFYCYFRAYPFLLFTFSLLHFLVVISVR